MNEVNVEQEVRQLVAKIFEVEASDIDQQANCVKDLGMDSMMSFPKEALPKFTKLNELLTIDRKMITALKFA